MSTEKFILHGFNRGIISPLALARVDLEKTGLAAETMTNFVPRVLGSMMLRPGTKYLGSTYTDSAAYYIPFIFSTDDTALIEVTNALVRVWVSDAVITRGSVSTTISNGDFSSLTNWTDADESGATSELYAGRALKLTGDGTNAAIRRQLVTVSAADAGDEHAVKVVIGRGPVNFMIGSYKGGDDYFTETELDEGTHSLAFTPSDDFYIQFKNVNKYSVLVESCTIESSGAMTITAPWASANLNDIRYDQSGDIIFVGCKDVAQYKIERRTTRSWSVVRYLSEDGPWESENITTTTITPSALSGDVTLTASKPIFGLDDFDGSLFRISSEGQSVSSSISAENTFTSTIRVSGTGANRVFSITRSGTWSATITLQRSLTDSTTNFEDVTTYTTNATVAYDDALDNQVAWYRIGIKTGNYTSGTAVLTLGYAIGSIDGVVRIIDTQNEWISRTSAADNNWRGIAWSPELSLFAAVSITGTGNRVMTSPDGITWTSRTSAADNLWYSIAWAPELSLFAAVANSGTGNRVMTSPDGITWTSRTSAADNDWYSIAWSPELSLFAAVAASGTGNRVMTSPDGITWTSRTSAADNQWIGIAWSPELSLFAAVSASGTGNRVMTSPDGITWTSRTPAADNDLYSIAWSPELSLFAAVASSGTGDRVMTTYGRATAKAVVLTELGDTVATDAWAPAAWSDYYGWPTAVAFAEGRLWWAGFNGIWGSVSDDYYNYSDSVEGDSGAIDRTIGIGPVDTINWINSLQRLVLGTEGNEFVCKSSSFDEPLTPTAFSLKVASTQGSASVDSEKIDNTGIYVQRCGSRLMELAIDVRDGEYGSSDLTTLNPEICQPYIVRISVQRMPDTRIHCVRSDGKVAIMVYDRAENVKSWWLYETDGTVEDVVVLPGSEGDTEDDVYYVVNRTINSSTKRYLEKWYLESQCQGSTLSRNIDCALEYSGVSTASMTGLSHLEGESVAVWANGKDLGDYTVTSGAITLSEATTAAIIGLSYTGQWKSMKLAYTQNYTSLLQKKKINHLGVILKNTHYQGLEFGPDFTTMDGLPLVENGVATAADTVHSTYDEDMFEFPGQWDTDSRLCLRATAPKPCNILAAVVGIEIHGKN